MRIWYYRYTLRPRRALSAIARPGAREGALIRAASGFADIHPWPELGDLPLDEQLSRLARGETTALTWASLRLARCDGQARERGVSLFEGLTIPRSHWPGADPPDEFDTVKLKSVDVLPPNRRLRIDFNNRLTPGEVVDVARDLRGLRIDFIEDPCPYDARVWRALRRETGLRLALDRGAADEGVDVIVHKPALQPVWPSFGGEIVVTSYMDHAIGQMGAAFVAAANDASDRCGLFTHVLYEPDPFFERIRAEGSRLLPVEGTGLGFDDLLEAIPWRELS